MKTLVWSALSNDSVLAEDIPADRWYSASAVLDVPTKPFAVIVWGPRTGILRSISAPTLRVNVHDERGDYTRIDRVIARVEEVVLSLVDLTEGAEHITEAQWLGASGELGDQDYKTNLRYVDFRVAGR